LVVLLHIILPPLDLDLLSVFNLPFDADFLLFCSMLVVKFTLAVIVFAKHLTVSVGTFFVLLVGLLGKDLVDLLINYFG